MRAHAFLARGSDGLSTQLARALLAHFARLCGVIALASQLAQMLLDSSVSAAAAHA